MQLPTPYVEICLYTFDEEKGHQYSEATRSLLSREVFSFANLGNATVAYDRLKTNLERSIRDGLHERTERMKPGPQTKTPVRSSGETQPTKESREGINSEATPEGTMRAKAGPKTQVVKLK